MNKRVIIEVGNSNLKFFDCQSRKLSKVHWRDVGFYSDIDASMQAYDEWMLFGTHPQMVAKISGRFKAANKKICKPLKERSLLQTDYVLASMGMDRYLALIAMEGVLAGSAGPSIETIAIVGAGTAWTLDVAKVSKVAKGAAGGLQTNHLGSVIALGPVGILASLAEKTGALPDLSEACKTWDWSALEGLGATTDTEQAIEGAVKAQMHGLFERMFSERKDLQPQKILLHGGGAQAAAATLKSLGYTCEIIPELLFLGAEKLWHNNHIEFYT
jgi:pantothenate kinase type III